ncbi:trypsin-like peptidase domain-containing protein [Nereida sp. MMG024]|nr:trypsin-like peptidase domain-containing protein [Nereida sp. MMG025]
MEKTMRQLICAIFIWFGVAFAPLTTATPAQAQAQETVWLQIEAQPSLTQAQDRIRDYAQDFTNIAGFDLGSGWYGIVLGPYDASEARTVLRQLRRDRRIPSDSFVQFPNRLRSQFWPVGAALPPAPVEDAQTDVPQTAQAQPEPEPEPEEPAAPVYVPDETRAEALRSEQQMSVEQKKDLQRALAWAGKYEAAIDGVYGRGTRGAMAAWQTRKGYPDTGILTSAQRAEALADWNAVFEGLGFAVLREPDAGLEMDLPLSIVTFDRYTPPFVRFEPTGAIEQARVLMISQAGGRDALAGLYDILQTLEVVPLEGPRSLRGDRFEIEGRSADFVSYTFAQTRNDEIKGYMLLWPNGDEDRRARVLERMQAGFTPIPGTLDPSAGDPSEQAVDLLSGLELRKPKRSRSGFFVDGAGTVVTHAETVAQCTRLTIDGLHDAEVLNLDLDAGIAVLRPKDTLAPDSFARFAVEPAQLGSEIAVAGYPYGGVLRAPTLTFGRLADLRGLQGEEELDRLDLTSAEGDVGGPVVGRDGAVLGMLIPPPVIGAQAFPPEVQFTLDSASLQTALDKAGVTTQTQPSGTRILAEDLTLRTRAFTVLVQCWD